MQTEMSSLRKEIDLVDEQIVWLLAKRFVLTYRVGELKATIGEAPLDPARQAQRRELLQRLASTHAVDGALLTDLFARIQKETVANHMSLAAKRKN
jgi:chorismate mutase